MEPWFAAAVLAGISCFTLTCYTFRIPDDLRKGGPGGRWGPPNAEFNWCEPDYELADWIAEPVNTVSNLAMIVLPLAFLACHRASADTALMAILTMVIAVGSILFHGSLRYSMQLLDELPMLWYSFVGSVSVLKRVKGITLEPIAAVYVTVVTLAILATEQHSTMHEAFRALMSCSFVASLIVMAWGSAALVSRLKEELTDKRRHVAISAERLHTGTFLVFVLSEMCWLVDNYFCPLLWQLPLGLPYPHLHTWWHLLISWVLYGLLIMYHLDDLRASPSVRLRYWMGVLPQVVS